MIQINQLKWYGYLLRMDDSLQHKFTRGHRVVEGHEEDHENH